MKIKDLLGKKVVSLKDGGFLGVLKNPVIDSAHRKIIGFIVEDTEWFLTTKIVFFHSIRGMEEEIITVDDKLAITPVQDLKMIHSYLIENVQIINMRIISESGKYLGKVDNFSFNIQTGKIEAYYVKEKDLALEWRDLISFGDGMLIFKELSILNSTWDVPSRLSGSDLNLLFERRQIEFLLGKISVRDIRTDRGGIVLPMGSVIDSEAIQKIKREGKFTELLMSVDSDD